ncbi:hypothetical protein P167DRAFT_520449 [Morchella conica CCBAS932]|uniref:CHAT domain-containing protein n=2 Tax=Morchella sect. Distantes TaxID=1051054 RepID=A0A3N4KU04_9PEZI|nr:hypothetical protein P167DRAFT_520449 [Morchella conica CCBAS932]
MEDLERAINLGREALDTTPKNHPYRPTLLNGLSSRIEIRFQANSDLKDLEDSISLAREAALREVPMGHIDRFNILNGLGISLSKRYSRSGDLSDLEQAILFSQEAVDKTSPNHPDWSIRVCNLCNRLSERYEHTGSLDDLQSAISLAENALAATPKDSNEVDRARILNNLTIALMSRYRYYRMKTLDDLEQAIVYAQKAVDETPENHPDRTGFLSSLGIMFGDRYLHSKATQDLDEAIFYSQRALDTAPSLDLSRVVYSTNLGNWLSTRFEARRDKGDLEKAIFCAEEACKILEKTPESPDRANVMQCLASKLWMRHRLTKNPKDHDLAVRYLSESMELVSSPVAKRIDCALTLGNIHMQYERWADVSRVTEYAINLLPRLSSRSLVQKDQQQSLILYAGLASKATAAALQANKSAADALKLLELGRGIITNHRFETRSDISELEREHPKLAQEYHRLCSELDSPKSTLGEHSESTTASVFSRRQAAEVKLDKVLEEIRQEPNFKNFLLTLDPSRLLATEPLGTIVVINVAFRCDAFLVQKDHTVSLPLPNLHQSEVHERSKLLKSGKLPMEDMLDMLKWLWDVVAGPVLEHLRITRAPENNNWPHIWWIPTGSFSNLPIHAAGHHLDNSGRSVLDRVISSYSPSIRSLVFAFQNKSLRRQVSSPEKVVFASMDNTPGMNKLPYVTMEIDQLQELLPKSIPCIRLNTPKRTEVLNELIGCNILHFAGHGISDPSDPSKSCLAVADEPLTVEDLIDQKLHQNPPLLAYLSACSTGNSNVDSLIDESIHLMGACQLAGFQNVIGSLWEVSDIHCVEVAKSVYITILDGRMSSKSVSLGLHNAIRALRGGSTRIEQVGEVRKARLVGVTKGKVLQLKDPRYWAAYIHMGI